MMMQAGQWRRERVWASWEEKRGGWIKTEAEMILAMAMAICRVGTLDRWFGSGFALRRLIELGDGLVSPLRDSSVRVLIEGC